VSLTFKKRSAVQVPVLSKPNIKELVDSLIQYPKELPKVLKTRSYILARLNGKKITEAKREAGVSPGATEKQILATPMAQILLNELVKAQIPDTDVVERLKEMWQATRVVAKYDPVTRTTVEMERPNWDVRKYAMDRRLALGGFANGVLPENQQQQTVTQIQFTTINVTNNKTEEVVQAVEQ
jgi:hypothetical protein